MATSPLRLSYSAPISSLPTQQEMDAQELDRARNERATGWGPLNPIIQGYQGWAAGDRAGGFNQQALDAEVEFGKDSPAFSSLRRKADMEAQKSAIQRNRVGSISEVNNVGDAFNYLGGGLGQVAGSMWPVVAGAATGMAVGGPGGALMGGLRGAAFKAAAPLIGGTIAGYDMNRGETVSGQYADPQAMERSAAERQGMASMTALGKSALDAIPAAYGLKGLAGAGKAARAERVMSRPMQTVVGAAGESGTEMLQTEADYQGLQALGSTKERNLTEYADAGILGAMGGGVFTGATNLVGSAMDKGANATQAVKDNKYVQEGTELLTTGGKAAWEIGKTTAGLAFDTATGAVKLTKRAADHVGLTGLDGMTVEGLKNNAARVVDAFIHSPAMDPALVAARKAADATSGIFGPETFDDSTQWLVDVFGKSKDLGELRENLFNGHPLGDFFVDIGLTEAQDPNVLNAPSDPAQTQEAMDKRAGLLEAGRRHAAQIIINSPSFSKLEKERAAGITDFANLGVKDSLWLGNRVAARYLAPRIAEMHEGARSLLQQLTDNISKSLSGAPDTTRRNSSVGVPDLLKGVPFTRAMPLAQAIAALSSDRAAESVDLARTLLAVDDALQYNAELDVDARSTIINWASLLNKSDSKGTVLKALRDIGANNLLNAFEQESNAPGAMADLRSPQSMLRGMIVDADSLSRSALEGIAGFVDEYAIKYVSEGLNKHQRDAILAKAIPAFGDEARAHKALTDFGMLRWERYERAWAEQEAQAEAAAGQEATNYRNDNPEKIALARRELAMRGVPDADIDRVIDRNLKKKFGKKLDAVTEEDIAEATFDAIVEIEAEYEGATGEFDGSSTYGEEYGALTEQGPAGLEASFKLRNPNRPFRNDDRALSKEAMDKRVAADPSTRILPLLDYLEGAGIDPALYVRKMAKDFQSLLRNGKGHQAAYDQFKADTGYTEEADDQKEALSVDVGTPIPENEGGGTRVTSPFREKMESLQLAVKRAETNLRSPGGAGEHRRAIEALEAHLDSEPNPYAGLKNYSVLASERNDTVASDTLLEKFKNTIANKTRATDEEIQAVKIHFKVVGGMTKMTLAADSMMAASPEKGGSMLTRFLGALGAVLNRPDVVGLDMTDAQLNAMVVSRKLGITFGDLVKREQKRFSKAGDVKKLREQLATRAKATEEEKVAHKAKYAAGVNTAEAEWRKKRGDVEGVARQARSIWQRFVNSARESMKLSMEIFALNKAIARLEAPRSAEALALLRKKGLYNPDAERERLRVSRELVARKSGELKNLPAERAEKNPLQLLRDNIASREEGPLTSELRGILAGMEAIRLKGTPSEEFIDSMLRIELGLAALDGSEAATKLREEIAETTNPKKLKRLNTRLQTLTASNGELAKLSALGDKTRKAKSKAKKAGDPVEDFNTDLALIDNRIRNIVNAAYPTTTRDTTTDLDVENEVRGVRSDQATDEIVNAYLNSAVLEERADIYDALRMFTDADRARAAAAAFEKDIAGLEDAQRRYVDASTGEFLDARITDQSKNVEPAAVLTDNVYDKDGKYVRGGTYVGGTPTSVAQERPSRRMLARMALNAAQATVAKLVKLKDLEPAQIRQLRVAREDVAGLTDFLSRAEAWEKRAPETVDGGSVQPMEGVNDRLAAAQEVWKQLDNEIKSLEQFDVVKAERKTALDAYKVVYNDKNASQSELSEVREAFEALDVEFKTLKEPDAQELKLLKAQRKIAAREWRMLDAVVFNEPKKKAAAEVSDKTEAEEVAAAIGRLQNKIDTGRAGTPNSYKPRMDELLQRAEQLAAPEVEAAPKSEAAPTVHPAIVEVLGRAPKFAAKKEAAKALGAKQIMAPQNVRNAWSSTLAAAAKRIGVLLNKGKNANPGAIIYASVPGASRDWSKASRDAFIEELKDALDAGAYIRLDTKQMAFSKHNVEGEGVVHRALYDAGYDFKEVKGLYGVWSHPSARQEGEADTTKRNSFVGKTSLYVQDAGEDGFALADDSTGERIDTGHPLENENTGYYATRKDAEKALADYNAVDPTRRNSFVGKKADAKGAARAARMIKAGQELKQVYWKTGWFLGPDGKLRKELDPTPIVDRIKALVASGVANTTVADVLKDTYPELLKKYGKEFGAITIDLNAPPTPGRPRHAGSFNATDKKITVTPKAAYMSLAFTTQAPRTDAQKSDFLDTLKRLSRHTDVTSFDTAIETASLEHLHRATGKLYPAVATSGLKNELPRAIAYVFIHELQHAIQNTEGFARGGNKDAALIAKFGTPEKIAAAKAEYQSGVLDGPAYKAALEEAKTEAAKTGDAAEAAAAAYKNLEGEEEARDVQARWNLTPSERALAVPVLMNTEREFLASVLREAPVPDITPDQIQKKAPKVPKPAPATAPAAPTPAPTPAPAPKAAPAAPQAAPAAPKAPAPKANRPPRRLWPAGVHPMAAEIEKIIVTSLGKGVGRKLNQTVAKMGSQGYFSGKAGELIAIAVDASDPFGTTHHEVMHAFFKRLGVDKKGRELKATLTAAVSLPHVLAKLEDFVKGMPDALAAIKQGAPDYMEERLALAYQIYATGGHATLGLTPAVRNIFGKIAAYFRSVLNLLNAAEVAEKVMVMLHSGELANANTIHEKLATLRIETSQQTFDRYVPYVGDAVRSVFKAGTDVLRDSGVQVLVDVADKFEGINGELGFIDRRTRAENIFTSRLAKLLDKHTEVGIREALENAQAMQPPKPGLDTEIAKLLNDLFAYMERKGVKTSRWVEGYTDDDGNSEPGYVEWIPIQKINKGRYFPRQWDADYIRTHEKEWNELLTKNKVSLGDAAKITEAIVKGDGRLELKEGEHHLGFTPYVQALQHRGMQFITEKNAAEFAKFQSKDAVDILTTYIRQAAHRGEYAELFGNNGEVIEAAIAESKLSVDEKVKMRRTISGLEGTLGWDMPQATKELFSAGITVQNVLLLPLAIYSQMIDPLMIAARSGDVMDAGRAYLEALKQLKNKITGERTEAQDLADMMGMLSEESVIAAMGNTHGSMYMSGGFRKFNEMFFRYNGLQGWNQSMRSAATLAGVRYLVKHKNNAAELAEIGLKPLDVVVGPNNSLVVKGNKRVQEALFRFVDESVVRPNALHRPTWMSDPRFMLISHLKQFTFSQHKVIIGRVADQAEKGNYQPMAMLALAAPVMLAADMAKWMMTGTVPDSWTWGDYASHAVQRAGILGKYQFGMDALNDAERGNTPGTSFLGPTFEHITTLFQGLTGSASGQEVLERSIPGGRYIF